MTRSASVLLHAMTVQICPQLGPKWCGTVCQKLLWQANITPASVRSWFKLHPMQIPPLHEVVSSALTCLSSLDICAQNPDSRSQKVGLTAAKLELDARPLCDTTFGAALRSNQFFGLAAALLEVRPLPLSTHLPQAGWRNTPASTACHSYTAECLKPVRGLCNGVVTTSFPTRPGTVSSSHHVLADSSSPGNGSHLCLVNQQAARLGLRRCFAVPTAGWRLGQRVQASQAPHRSWR